LINEQHIINGTASLNSNSPSFSSSGTSTATSSLILTPTNTNGTNNIKSFNNNRINEQMNGQAYKMNGHLLNLSDSLVQVDYDNHRNIQNGYIKCSNLNEINNEANINSNNNNNNTLILNHATNKKQAKIIANQNGHSIANGFLNKYPKVRQNSMSKSMQHFKGFNLSKFLNKNVPYLSIVCMM
jgi:hypothetical protein